MWTVQIYLAQKSFWFRARFKTGNIWNENGGTHNRKLHNGILRDLEVSLSTSIYWLDNRVFFCFTQWLILIMSSLIWMNSLQKTWSYPLKTFFSKCEFRVFLEYFSLDYLKTFHFICIRVSQWININPFLQSTVFQKN